MFHVIPHPGEVGYETWPAEAYKNQGGVHNWSESTVDEQRGIAFINLGSPRFDFYGGDRPGNNLFGNSLVALDARTGRRLWHYQLVHHDLWDYDLPQAPKLLTIRQNNRNIDVVAQATKHGFLFVFERETGRPIWPIEERPVPQSDVPGEFASPTQPFPTRPAPFARQTMTEKDINPYLPAAERQAIVERFRTLRNDGLFTPPSFEGSISLPGHNGGANFASSAVDPTRGEMYIAAKALPTVNRIALPGAGGRGGGALGGGPAGSIVTPAQKAADDCRGAEARRRGESQGRIGALRVAVRVLQRQQLQHEQHRSAVVGDDSLRPQHRRGEVAHSDGHGQRAAGAQHPGRYGIACSRAAGRWRRRAG